jgi:4'-phosphopantetheinyl transferase
VPDVDLPRDRVDFWLTPVDDWDPDYARESLLGWLDEREHAAFDRYRFARHKHLHLVAHALVRRTLSLYADGEPAAWRFAIAPGGKPELAGPTPLPLRFNLSHTKGVAAVGVTAMGRIGVDVEVGKAPGTMIALGRRFFAPLEVAAMERRSEAEAAALALELWTLKEAFMKAVGLGMALSPRRFAFDVEADGPRRLLSTGLDGESPESWSFATIDAGIAGARAAVAVETGTSPSLRVRRLDPPEWRMGAVAG